MTPISADQLLLDACFATRESCLLLELLRLRSRMPERQAALTAEVFESSLAGLQHILKATESSPSIYASPYASPMAGSSAWSLESLINNLCGSDPSGLEFHLPSRVVIGQAYLHAKINFFRDLIAILGDEIRDAEIRRVKDGLDDVLADAMYFKLAEELLIGSLANVANSMELKKAAAELLLPMWEQRHTPPIQAFIRLLLSAWKARCRVQEVFGSLAGFHEVTLLLMAECDKAFLDFFNRVDVTQDKREALREFLFGIAYEDLQKLEQYMEEHGIRNIGPEDVSRILGHTRYQNRPLVNPFGKGNPEAVYLSYRRRRFRADYRVFTNQPGPHKTAEGYLMEYHLLHEPKPHERGATV